METEEIKAKRIACVHELRRTAEFCIGRLYPLLHPYYCRNCGWLPTADREKE